jgi:hypothetical protein
MPISRLGATRLTLSALGSIVFLAACGGSSAATPPAKSAPVTTPSAQPLPSATAASPTCPSGVTVGTALGITLPNPTGVAARGGTPLPGSATGVACEYAGKSYNVFIELIRNISPSYIANFSNRFPVPFVSVSGVGDQARSFLAPLNGGKDNEGVVATKGRTLVSITATATPASLGQLEVLLRQLL